MATRRKTKTADIVAEAKEVTEVADKQDEKVAEEETVTVAEEETVTGDLPVDTAVSYIVIREFLDKENGYQYNAVGDRYPKERNLEISDSRYAELVELAFIKEDREDGTVT